MANVRSKCGSCYTQVPTALGNDFPVAQDFTVKLLQKGAREYQQGGTGWDQDPLVFHGFPWGVPWLIQVFKPFHI